MSLSVSIRPFAELDLAEAQAYYLQQGDALADRFLMQVHAAIGRIVETPQLFPKVLRDVHKAPVRVFPYSILYVVRNDAVLVIAVYHASRNPSGWKSRLRSS